MDKRTLLAIAICMGILVIWGVLFPQRDPPPKPVATAPAATAPVTDKTAAAPAPGTPAEGAAAAPTATQPEERVVLETAEMRFVLTNRGAALADATVKDPKFRKERNDPATAHQLVPSGRLPLGLTFPKADFTPPAATAWAVKSKSADAVVFRAEGEGVAVEKAYQVESPYRLKLTVTIENRASKAQTSSVAIHLFTKQDPAKKGGGFWDMASADLASVVCFVEDEAERSTPEALQKGQEENVGTVRWVAADDKYFVMAAVPYPESPFQPRKCVRRGIDALEGEAVLSFGDRTVPPGQQTKYDFTVYAGPKYIAALEEVKPGGESAQLDKVVDVTFAVLSRPLLYLMKVFHGWVGNWGLAIIMLTFFVKLVTFWPTQKAMMSGKKMQRLAPKMQELRKKYENDRQKMGVETMNLYKQHGVNPVGGCLPTLITMPIWIALFSTLNYAVELHQAPFFGYIQDLSARDKYFITPLIMGGIMFLQMRMSPAGADPQQQKMMAIMMPLMFTGFSLFLPAGLAIYTLTNSLLAIAQQVLVNRLDARANPA